MMDGLLIGIGIAIAGLFIGLGIENLGKCINLGMIKIHFKDVK